MTQLKDYRSDFVLLVEAGFIAVSYLDEDGATKLFDAAQLLEPHSTAPSLGHAAIALHKLDLKKSNTILEKVMEQEPENHRAGALLGISYLLSDKDVPHGEQLLEAAMTKSDDPATRRLGELWLEVLEKGKATGPLEPQPKKASKKQKKA